MKVVFTILFLSLTMSSVHAAELAGVTLPDTIEQNGKVLTLNGVAIRKATFFRIKVYVMGLYLERVEHDPDKIVNSLGEKQIVLKFVRSVDAGKLQDAWVEGFEDNYGDYSKIKSQVNVLVDGMVDVADGDIISFVFSGDEVLIDVNKGKNLRLSGREFQRGLLLIWLGPNPPNAAMKEDLLKGRVE